MAQGSQKPPLPKPDLVDHDYISISKASTDTFSNDHDDAEVGVSKQISDSASIPGPVKIFKLYRHPTQKSGAVYVHRAKKSLLSASAKISEPNTTFHICKASNEPVPFSYLVKAPAKRAHLNSSLPSASIKHARISSDPTPSTSSQVFKVSQPSHDSAQTQDKSTLCNFILPPAPVIHSINSPGFKTLAHYFPRLSSDSVQALKKETTSDATAVGSYSNAPPTSSPVKIVGRSCEYSKKEGLYFDSNSTEGSFIVDLSCDSSSVPDFLCLSEEIVKVRPDSGSSGIGKLPCASRSLLNSLGEKIPRDQEIFPRVSSSLNSLLLQHEVLKNQSDSLSSLPAKGKSKKFKSQVCGLFPSTRQSQHKLVNRKQMDSYQAKKTRLKFVCPECPHFEGKSNKALLIHLTNDHNKNMKVLHKNFHSEEEFEQWKLNMEMETCSRFVSKRGVSFTAHKSALYYNCHRSGTARVGQNRKRRRKASAKIGTHCTAYIKKISNLETKAVSIEYCLDHIGHDFNPVHLQISMDLKRTIADRLAKGDDPWDVFDDVKAQEFKCERDAMLTMKDIDNISKSYNITPTLNKNRERKCLLCNFQTKSRFAFENHKKKHHQCLIDNNKTEVNDELTIEPDVSINRAEFEWTNPSFEIDSENVSQTLQREDNSNPNQIFKVKASIKKKLEDLIQTVVKMNNKTILQEFNTRLDTICTFALESQ